MGEKVGIKPLKAVLQLGFVLENNVQKALKDGIGFNDTMYLIPVFNQIGEVVSVWDKIPASVKDLSAEEQDILMKFVKAEFDIPDDKLEATIEAWFQAGLTTLRQYI